MDLRAVCFLDTLCPMKLGYLKQLDGVRAIAALLVMFPHFFTWLPAESSATRVLRHFAVIGQSGVTLFFVLSGFLITRILLVTKDDPHFFKDFYIRRILRIFPLYYLFLVITYFVVPIWQHTPFVPFSEQVYYWVYLQDCVFTFNWKANGPWHFWSLAVEEHFYLLWPVLVYYLSRKGIKRAILAIVVIAIGCRLFLIHRGLEVFYFTFTRMDDLAIGALLAVWEKEGVLKGSASKFAIGALVAIFPTFALWSEVTGKALPGMLLIKSNLVAICGFCVIGLAISVKVSNVLYKVLSSRFFTFTGKISYGLYVYHPLCFLLVNEYFPSLSLIMRIVISVSFVYLVAGVSFYLFEAKFISLKKYFAYGRGVSLEKQRARVVG